MHPSYVLDLGNSRLKVGRVEHGRLADEPETWERSQAAEMLAALLNRPSSGFMVLSTGRDDAAILNPLQQLAPVKWASGELPSPLTLAYDTPQTLGADRLAAAIGAQTLYPEHDLLVVDAGTCITYEWVTADKVYRGGSIAPGLRMRLQAMHSFTGKLPEAPVAWPSGEIGTDTISALQSGALHGAALEVNGWIGRHRQLYPQGVTLLCGGDAAFLLAALPAEVAYRPHLVLEGLAQWQKHAETS